MCASYFRIGSQIMEDKDNLVKPKESISITDTS